MAGRFIDACRDNLLVSDDLLKEYTLKCGNDVKAVGAIKNLVGRWLEHQNEVAVDGQVEQALVLWLDKNYAKRFSQ